MLPAFPQLAFLVTRIATIQRIRDCDPKNGMLFYSDDFTTVAAESISKQRGIRRILRKRFLIENEVCS